MENSAVEWLYNIMYKHKGNITISEYEQAKEMEKQNLYNFYMQGGVDAMFESDRTVEQYYNETFKSK